MTDITDAEAEALLRVAQDVVLLVTKRSHEIAPDNIVGAVLSVLETAHASVLAAMLLAEHGPTAGDGIGAALDKAKDHLGSFTGTFVTHGIELIESGHYVGARPQL